MMGSKRPVPAAQCKKSAMAHIERAYSAMNDIVTVQWQPAQNAPLACKHIHQMALDGRVCRPYSFVCFPASGCRRGWRQLAASPTVNPFPTRTLVNCWTSTCKRSIGNLQGWTTQDKPIYWCGHGPQEPGRHWTPAGLQATRLLVQHMAMF